MNAKTIFLTEELAYVYESMWHDDNHSNYIKKYFSNLKVTEYIPLFLIKYNHCVIDLSKPYNLGTVFIPSEMNDFQRDYFIKNRTMLSYYTLYLNISSLTEPVSIDKLLSLIKK